MSPSVRKAFDSATPKGKEKRIDFFERYLSLCDLSLPA